MNVKKLIILLFCIGAVFINSISAQTIITAESYFDSISEYYGTVTDYQGHILISYGDSVMEGTIHYKSPNLIRIDFTYPANQVICVDGEELKIYIPHLMTALVQKLKSHNEAAIATMVNEQGLLLIKQGYSISYLTGQDAVPLEEESAEFVQKLKLQRRTIDEGFRQIEMSVGENKLIRRMVGITNDFEKFQIDLTGLKINQNIPKARFEFDIPADVPETKNFLFEPED